MSQDCPTSQSRMRSRPRIMVENSNLSLMICLRAMGSTPWSMYLTLTQESLLNAERCRLHIGVLWKRVVAKEEWTRVDTRGYPYGARDPIRKRFIPLVFRDIFNMIQILSHASTFAVVPSEYAEKINQSGLGLLSTWSPQQTILNHPVSTNCLDQLN